MNYNFINKINGWVVFTIATIVYMLTIEDTASLWDCGEYITAAYKLEVGHPPGAPLFMILGRVFSFFAAPENVAFYINSLSALSSSFTILFMFWSITMLLKKLILQGKNELENHDKIGIFVAATIGSLSYTFTDSFWFSAVEGEVYAMASLFTAVIFWAILKWDEEMGELQANRLSSDVAPNRWLLLILFLLGLAIGVHLLGILVVPAIIYFIYFRVRGEVNNKFSVLKLIGWFTLAGSVFIFSGLIIAIGSIEPNQGKLLLTLFKLLIVVTLIGLGWYHRVSLLRARTLEFLGVGGLSIIILGFIQEGIIPGTISMASSFEVAFVNNLGLPFYTGSLFFFALLITACVYGVYYTRKKNLTILSNSLMGLVLLLIGYGSFAVIVIRSNANTPLDENDPENLVTLHSYLKREQYGSAPIFTGPLWNSKENPRAEFDDLSPYYLRRWVVVDNDANKDLKGFVNEKDAKKWALTEYNNSLPENIEVKEKYFETNSSIRKNATPTYEQNFIFPRMYAQSNRHIAGYKFWSGYDAEDGTETELGKDDKRLPTMSEVMRYFMQYQINWMYFRYFMWNFAGRQNDIQGHGDNMRGNWISGFNFIDESRLGSQEFAPHYTSENKSNNKFYFIPLIFALIGLIYHYLKAPKDAFVLTLAFLFTGIAIVVYLNQKPFEPRERDYAYAGSFYFFAMWISFGVYALIDFLKSKAKIQNANLRVGLAGALGLAVPLILAVEGWDDHNRSGKTTARDLARNYLASCEKNGIIFTNGDNDTFPLWYIQEVEGYRTDVRVCNLSLMGTDWYTNQMKMKAYESAPLPIKFTEDQILMYGGNTDQMYFLDLSSIILGSVIKSERIKEIIKLRLENPQNLAQAQGNFTQFQQALQSIMFQVKSVSLKAKSEVEKINKKINAYLIDSQNKDFSESLFAQFMTIKYVYPLLEDELELLKSKINRGENSDLNEKKYNQIVGLIKQMTDVYDSYEKTWNTVDLKKAMQFMYDEKGLIQMKNGGEVNIFPSSVFTLDVNKENAIKAGIINATDSCRSSITLNYDGETMITREEIMMLDIMSNFDWKRGVYFSSNRGSKLATRLLSQGCLKQIGVAYELNPSVSRNQNFRNQKQRFFNVEKMYEKLMKTYEYGQMSDANVLTDYYARRHTSHYRQDFVLLAEQLYYQGDTTRALKALDKSLAIMPPETVLDFGEITGFDPITSLDINQAQNDKYKARTSGNLHEHVQLYYMLGAADKAEKLGKKLLKNYESVFKYFENSDAIFSVIPGVISSNYDDLFAATDACFKMHKIASDPLFNPEQKNLKEISETLNYVYSIVLPKIYSGLDELELEESYSEVREVLEGQMNNMLLEYDYTVKPK